MGTRADFYIGRGKDAKWLGSTAWDGYPDGIVPEGGWPSIHLFDSADINQFTECLALFYRRREDLTLPEDGWPWPWDDSGTTDYAYAFDEGRVWASSFGGNWFDPRESEPEDEDIGPKVQFPIMKDKKNVTLGRRSGLMIFG